VVNALSIDVEDYFHANVFDRVVSPEAWAGLEGRVAPNTDRLLEILDGAGVRATFFVLGWVADRHPALVRAIAAAGHELASHGYAHRLVYTLTRDAFRDDVRRSKAIVEDLCGRAVRGYRAPSYSITNDSRWALDVLVEEGYAYDASIFPIRHDRYGIPDAPRHPHRLQVGAGALWEVPGSTVRCAGVNLPIAGGGYFRQFPYAFTRWGIGRVNRREGRAVIFYLHPWEIDARQPRLPLPLVSRVRHYRNLGRTEARLRRLLDDFRFDSIERVLGLSTAAASQTAA
jgi:polysaccharide deacetylase family protein (PEP-CTERM system associated)